MRLFSLFCCYTGSTRQNPVSEVEKKWQKILKKPATTIQLADFVKYVSQDNNVKQADLNLSLFMGERPRSQGVLQSVNNDPTTIEGLWRSLMGTRQDSADSEPTLKIINLLVNVIHGMMLCHRAINFPELTKLCEHFFPGHINKKELVFNLLTCCINEYYRGRDGSIKLENDAFCSYALVDNILVKSAAPNFKGCVFNLENNREYNDRQAYITMNFGIDTASAHQILNFITRVEDHVPSTRQSNSSWSNLFSGEVLITRKSVKDKLSKIPGGYTCKREVDEWIGSLVHDHGNHRNIPNLMSIMTALTLTLNGSNPQSKEIRRENLENLCKNYLPQFPEDKIPLLATALIICCTHKDSFKLFRGKFTRGFRNVIKPMKELGVRFRAGLREVTKLIMRYNQKTLPGDGVTRILAKIKYPANYSEVLKDIVNNLSGTNEYIVSPPPISSRHIEDDGCYPYYPPENSGAYADADAPAYPPSIRNSGSSSDDLGFFRLGQKAPSNRSDSRTPIPVVVTPSQTPAAATPLSSKVSSTTSASTSNDKKSADTPPAHISLVTLESSPLSEQDSVSNSQRHHVTPASLPPSVSRPPMPSNFSRFSWSLPNPLRSTSKPMSPQTPVSIFIASSTRAPNLASQEEGSPARPDSGRPDNGRPDSGGVADNESPDSSKFSNISIVSSSSSEPSLVGRITDFFYNSKKTKDDLGKRSKSR